MMMSTTVHKWVGHDDFISKFLVKYRFGSCFFKGYGMYKYPYEELFLHLARTPFTNMK